MRYYIALSEMTTADKCKVFLHEYPGNFPLYLHTRQAMKDLTSTI